MVLLEYLIFLKNNHIDDLALENAQQFNTRNIPLLSLFKDITGPELVAVTKRGLLKLIGDFESKREYTELLVSIKRWLNNENPGFSREQVKIEDLVNIYGAQKEAILHFVPMFTSDTATSVQIFKELETYYSTAYRLTIEAFVGIHEEELKKREKKYRLLAENSSDIITNQTAAGVIVYISPSCKQVLGYDRQEMTGKNISEFAHPDDATALDIKIPADEAHLIHIATVRMKRKDGTYIWLEVTRKNIVDPQTNEIAEVHTSARNITARKTAEELLRQNEALLSESQRIANVGSWEWDLGTNELTWTPEHYAIYGLDPAAGKITYETAAQMRDPEDSSLIQETITNAIKHNMPFELTHRLIINGNTKLVHVKGEIVAQNGEIVKLRGTSQDITQMSHIRQQLEKKNRQLEEAQQVAQLGIWEWNTESNEVTWSDEMYHIFGYEPGSVSIDFKFYLSRIFEADRPEVERRITACYTDGKPYFFENRIVTKDGYIKWLYATGQVAEKKGNKTFILSGTALDITQRKNIANALDEKVRDLEKSNNELQMFASVASHDLKEPLRKIKTNAGIVTASYGHSLDPKIIKYIDKIESAAARMEKLIEDVLAMSQVSNDKTNLEKADINLIISRCIGDLETLIQSKNVIIKTEPLPSDLTFNPDQVYQLFQNLITNSLKFSDKEEPQINITFNTGKPPMVTDAPYDQYCNIIFSDNGIGFEQVYAEKIFVMFQRLHEKEKYEGTGIGLAICKKIVENHHGYIRADGEPGIGAKFTISLPLQPLLINYN